MTDQNAITFQAPRLPYSPVMQEKFGIDKGQWKVLVEATFPNATSPDSIALVLAYCKSRKLDVFKKCVHIVPIWDRVRKRMVDTVWPGIGELRTTATRTGVYAGRDATVFGETTEGTWDDGKGGEVKVKYPYSAQVTVYKIVKDTRCAFVGPIVYWEEIFASIKSGAPNSMWQKRPSGQLDKCAEALALRAAFPEELGDEPCSDEAPMIHQHGIQEQHVKTFPEAQEAAETEIDEKAKEVVTTFEEEVKPEAKPAPVQESKVTKPAFMDD